MTKPLFADVLYGRPPIILKTALEIIRLDVFKLVNLFPLFSGYLLLVVQDSMETVAWSFLPDHVLVDVFSYLTISDRYQASQTCASWNFAFCSPHLWKKVRFEFKDPEDERHLKFLDQFGHFVQSLHICVDQEVEECRECACQLICRLARMPNRQLQRFRLLFIGQNPCLYSGSEFLDALSLLFGSNGESKSLRTVDLRGLLVSFSGELLEILSENHPDLEVLNIQNNALICKVYPNSLLTLVNRCRKLKELCVFSISCTEEVLLALIEKDREPLRRLSIFCRREEKYVKDIPSSVWQRIANRLPELRVTLGFDNTIELLKVREVMKPEIPVNELRLETATDLWHEVRLACSFYKDFLEKLIVKSPPSKNQRELDEALLTVARECPLLRSLHVFYVLEEETVKKILELCPVMREKETYTLKYVAEPHPWKPGKDF